MKHCLLHFKDIPLSSKQIEKKKTVTSVSVRDKQVHIGASLLNIFSWYFQKKRGNEWMEWMRIKDKPNNERIYIKIYKMKQKKIRVSVIFVDIDYICRICNYVYNWKFDYLADFGNT